MVGENLTMPTVYLDEVYLLEYGTAFYSDAQWIDIYRSLGTSLPGLSRPSVGPTYQVNYFQLKL